jgi:hypothetical protein
MSQPEGLIPEGVEGTPLVLQPTSEPRISRLLAVVDPKFQVSASDPIFNYPTREFPIFPDGDDQEAPPIATMLLPDEDGVRDITLGEKPVRGFDTAWGPVWQGVIEDHQRVLASTEFKVATGVALGMATVASLQGALHLDGQSMGDSIANLIPHDDSLAQGATIGGRGFEMSASPGSQPEFSWQDGNIQTGYGIFRLRFSTGGTELIPQGGIQASARSFQDNLSEAALYMLVVGGPNGQLWTSDIIGRLPIEGSTNPLTMRTTESNTFKFSFNRRADTPDYKLLTFGVGFTQVPAGVSNMDMTANGLTCYALGGFDNSGNLKNYSDALCGLPGFANFPPVVDLTPAYTITPTSTDLVTATRTPTATETRTKTPTVTLTPTIVLSRTPTLTPQSFQLTQNVDAGVPSADVQYATEGVNAAIVNMRTRYGFEMDGILNLRLRNDTTGPHAAYRLVEIGVLDPTWRGSSPNGKRNTGSHEGGHQIAYFLSNNYDTGLWGDWWIVEGTAQFIADDSLTQAGYYQPLQKEACDVQYIVRIPVETPLRQMNASNPNLPVWGIASLAVRNFVDRFGNQAVPTYMRNIRSGPEVAFQMATNGVSQDSFAASFDATRAQLAFPGTKYQQWANSDPCIGL